jgi:hypothetical protein
MGGSFTVPMYFKMDVCNCIFVDIVHITRLSFSGHNFFDRCSAQSLKDTAAHPNFNGI